MLADLRPTSSNCDCNHLTRIVVTQLQSGGCYGKEEKQATIFIELGEELGASHK